MAKLSNRTLKRIESKRLGRIKNRNTAAAMNGGRTPPRGAAECRAYRNQCVDAAGERLEARIAAAEIDRADERLSVACSGLTVHQYRTRARKG